MLPKAALLLALVTTHIALAQSVQPVIMEYASHAEGSFDVTNTSLQPLVLTIEPHSFSIDPDGRGVFRPLDSTIHLELSTMSLRLRPLETSRIFYKASAEIVPAWFSIYTTFAAARHGSSLDVRIQLPHTVYLYQKTAIAPSAITIQSLTYSSATNTIVCDLKNTGTALGRVHEVRPIGEHSLSESIAGFPLLPGATRHLEIPWQEKDPPRQLQFIFENFTLRPHIALDAVTTAAPQLAPQPGPG